MHAGCYELRGPGSASECARALSHPGRVVGSRGTCRSDFKGPCALARLRRCEECCVSNTWKKAE
eukprot:4489330-Prymnesium_polylepis.1